MCSLSASMFLSSSNSVHTEWMGYTCILYLRWLFVHVLLSICSYHNWYFCTVHWNHNYEKHRWVSPFVGLRLTVIHTNETFKPIFGWRRSVFLQLALVAEICLLCVLVKTGTIYILWWEIHGKKKTQLPNSRKRLPLEIVVVNRWRTCGQEVIGTLMTSCLLWRVAKLKVKLLVGCFEDPRHFSDISAILLLGSRIRRY